MGMCDTVSMVFRYTYDLNYGVKWVTNVNENVIWTERVLVSSCFNDFGQRFFYASQMKFTAYLVFFGAIDDNFAI